WRRWQLETSWSPAEVPRELPRVFASSAPGAAAAWSGAVGTTGFRLQSQGAQGRLVALGRFRARAGAPGTTVFVTLRPSFPAMALYLAALPVTVLLSLAVTFAAMTRGDTLVIVVWALPLVVLPHVIFPFAEDMSDGEARLRRLFPPPAPPSLGPFR
ncbi:MAG: hypothetical protein JOZ69_12590, partial [Myxococcales bacterium]|nr:hypothetical protein [Myxococcales bacterium]